MLTCASDRSGEMSEESKNKRKGNKHALGYKHSDDAKLKISKAHKGNQYSLGVKHSEEQNSQNH